MISVLETAARVMPQGGPAALRAVVELAVGVVELDTPPEDWLATGGQS